MTPLGVTGREAEALLDDVGITVNKNAIPFDANPPNIASGIRIGTPATTTRGMGPDEMRTIGRLDRGGDPGPRRRRPSTRGSGPRSASWSPGSRSPASRATAPRARTGRCG